MSFLAQYWHEVRPENPAKSSAFAREQRRFTDPGFYNESPASSPPNSPVTGPQQSRISALFADLIARRLLSPVSDGSPTGNRGSLFNSALEGSELPMYSAMQIISRRLAYHMTSQFL